MKNRVAIIDMGTNTFHLMIADINEGKHAIVHRERTAVKIGMGGINDGLITEAGAERALTALKKFKQTIDTHHVNRVLAFGTSALRNAKNGEEIIERIKRTTGIEAKIISGDEEARLIYMGVKSAMDLGPEKSLIIDIGGGSVEFIIASQEEIFWKQSIEIGAQRLLEKFHPHEPILSEEIESLNSFFTEALQPVFDQLEKHRPHTLVGSSGTFDTLSEIYCIRRDLHKLLQNIETPLSFGGFYEIYEELITKDRAQRMLMPGMIEMRVDMIVVACCLIRFLIEHHQFRNVRVSTYSLKEGVLASLSE